MLSPKLHSVGSNPINFIGELKRRCHKLIKDMILLDIVEALQKGGLSHEDAKEKASNFKIQRFMREGFMIYDTYVWQ